MHVSDRRRTSAKLLALRGPLIIAAAVVVADQLTKHWALNALDNGRVIDLVGSLRLNLAFNTGDGVLAG